MDAPIAQQNTTNNNTYPQIKTQAYQITGGCNMFTADFDTGSWHDGVVEPGDYQILRMTHYKKRLCKPPEIIAYTQRKQPKVRRLTPSKQDVNQSDTVPYWEGSI